MLHITSTLLRLGGRFAYNVPFYDFSPAVSNVLRGIADAADHIYSSVVTPKLGVSTDMPHAVIDVPSTDSPVIITKDTPAKPSPLTQNPQCPATSGTASVSSVTTSPAAAVVVRKQFYRRPLPDICISFCSPRGKAIFAEALAAGHMESYFPLASQFRTQDEPAFCGLTSLVMALNSLEVDPHRIWKGPWRYYHENMLDCCVPLATVERSGVTMDQFACLAACNTLHVRMVRADAEMSEADFRTVVLDVTRSTDQVVVSSYSRQALKQTGDGHFSPIGGYHPGHDMVLIMDTARFKYPPHWVSLSALFEAMQRIDKASGLPRGYFVLSKSRFNPALLFHLSSMLSPMALEQKHSGVVGFLRTWQCWLLTTVTVDDIIQAAICKLIELVDVLDNDAFLLATHVAMVAPDDESELSALLPPVGHANGDLVRRLLLAIETLPIYESVQTILVSLSSQSGIDKIGRKTVVALPGKYSPSTKPGLSIGGIVSKANNVRSSCDNIGDCTTEMDAWVPVHGVPVTGAHFVLMLLLSWPYHRCSRNTYGLALQKYMTSQLRLVKSVPGLELVHNEASHLRQQLATLINYAGSVQCSGYSEK